MAFILDTPEAIKAVQVPANGWEEQKPVITDEMHKTKIFAPHPSGYYKTAFVFLCILEVIKTDDPCKEVQDAILFLQTKTSPAAHAENITACTAKYPRPMAGRIWIFNLVLSMVAPEEYRSA
eukprot:11344161-Heterocapsa_arctica.AAC.1